MKLPYIIVTGSSRGIGAEIVRQLASHKSWNQEFQILATARDKSKIGGSDAIRKWALDVASAESVESLAATLSNEGAAVRAIINNAGVYIGGRSPIEKAEDLFRVNYHGPRWLSNMLLPQLATGGRIIHISSGMGELSGFSKESASQLQNIDEQALNELVERYIDWKDQSNSHDPILGWPSNPYSASKGALNALARAQHRAWSERGICVVSVCPGWVRTDMGGAGASRSVEKGAETPVWAATTPSLESGHFYRDMQIIPW